MSTIIIAECKEPWLFWWALKIIRETYPQELVYPETKSIKEIWEMDRFHDLHDKDWIELADAMFRGHSFSPEQQQEIWRQVYRIASERI